MMSLRDQRACFASRCILSQRFQLAHAQVHREELKRYRSAVLSATAYLRSCGLLQLAAFWLGKREQERWLVEDIVTWLGENDITRRMCEARQGEPARDALSDAAGPRLLMALAQRSSDELAILEREAEEICGWLKRVAEAIWVEVNPGEEGDDEHSD